MYTQALDIMSKQELAADRTLPTGSFVSATAPKNRRAGCATR